MYKTKRQEQLGDIKEERLGDTRPRIRRERVIESFVFSCFIVRKPPERNHLYIVYR